MLHLSKATNKYIVDCRGVVKLGGPDPWYKRVWSRLGGGL